MKVKVSLNAWELIPQERMIFSDSAIHIIIFFFDHSFQIILKIIIIIYIFAMESTSSDGCSMDFPIYQIFFFVTFSRSLNALERERPYKRTVTIMHMVTNNPAPLRTQGPVFQAAFLFFLHGLLLCLNSEGTFLYIFERNTEIMRIGKSCFISNSRGFHICWSK